ncbi:MAG: hypothetical protein ACON3Z_14265 [Bradymonadia bacterium]
MSELKDITEEAGAQAKRTASAPKQRRTSSFIDDADSLLADIRSEVDLAVTTGAAALKDRKTANMEALELQRREAELKQQAEVEAQLAAEAARQQAAADEREYRRRTLSGDPHPEEVAAAAALEAEQARQAALAAQAAAQVQTPVNEPEPPKKRGAGFYVAIVGALLGLLGAAAFFVSGEQPKPQPTPVVKTQAEKAPNRQIGGASTTKTEKPKTVAETAKTKPVGIDDPKAAADKPNQAQQAESAVTRQPKTKKPARTKSKSRSRSTSSKKAARKKVRSRPTKAKKPKPKKKKLKLNLGGF